MALPIWAWRKVVGASAPKAVSVSKASLANEGAADASATSVATERRTFLASAPDEDVPPTRHISAYRFGKDLVPTNSSDAERLKYGVDTKVLQLIGTVPRDEVRRGQGGLAMRAVDDATVDDDGCESTTRSCAPPSSSSRRRGLLSATRTTKGVKGS